MELLRCCKKAYLDLERENNFAMKWKIYFSLLVYTLIEDARGSPPGCTPLLNSFYGTTLLANDNSTDIQELLFMSVQGPFHERQICKMQCKDGRWIGPFCSNNAAGDGATLSETEKQCYVANVPENISVTYMETEIEISMGVSFEAASTLNFRCKVPGRYKFIGDRTMTCRDGKWSKKFPTCIPTNYFNGYKGDTFPPAIEWEVAGGIGALDDKGSLILLPKSILHLNCLFPRFNGNPEWQWSSNYRKYPTGWALNLKQRDLHYRLSIYYADLRDTGVFTCISPQGITNAIHVEVKDVSCPRMKLEDGLRIVSGYSSRMGSKSNFTCPTGYILRGEPSLTCLPSGMWSSELPSCEIIRCPKPVVIDPNLKLKFVDIFFGGKAEFFCHKDFALEGPSELTCQLNGSWSDKVPKCREIICPPLKPPVHGRLQIVGENRVDSVAVYSCHDKYILHGNIISLCSPAGNWTNHQPTCEPACNHPGTPNNGRLVPRRAKYEIGFIVLVSCKPGFRPAGPDRLKCLETRRWSSPLTPCVSSLG